MSIKNIFNVKFVVLMLVVVCVVVSVVSVSVQSIVELIKKGKIIIGVVSGILFFGLVDVKGVFIGYDVDVVNLIGKYFGLLVEIVLLVLLVCILVLELGKVDMLVVILVFMFECVKLVLFMIFYSGFELFIVGLVGINYKKFDDLVKKKVGVLCGFINDIVLICLVFLGMVLVCFEDDFMVMQVLLLNQVDVIFIFNIMVNEIVKSCGQGKIEVKFLYLV